MKEKILLVNPFYTYKNKKIWRYTRIWQPLDLAIASSLLEKKEFDVNILDLNAFRIPIIKAVNKNKNYSKIFITSGSLDLWQCPHLDIESFINTVKELKQIYPVSKFYIFGPNVTTRPKELLEITKANAAIIGEPELTIVDVCENRDISKVDGIAYIENNEFKMTRSRELADISKFPPPAFHLLPMKRYYYEIMGSDFALLETTRGCPFLCNFCVEDKMYGTRYRMKPLKLIEKEIDICVNEYGVKNIYFIDLEFTLSKAFVNEICEMITRNGYNIKWGCQTRADMIDLELLKKMKAAGCSIIHYGLESGSQKILDSTNKRISLENIKYGVKLAKYVGMKVVCFAMMGFPKETVEDMRKTIEFTKEIDPDFVSFLIATPYPGTKFYEDIKNKVNDLFPVSYEEVYSEKFIKHMTRRAFIEFYIRPSYMFKKIFDSPSLLFNEFKLFMNFVK